MSGNIDEETISRLGLTISHKQINSQITPYARVFEYPHLDNVFVMENDLYGATMPEHFCFIAFYGRNGLIGKPMSIDELKNASLEKIRKLVVDNSEG